MQIENEIYYHVHKKDYEPEKWEVGKIFEFNKDAFNYFFNFYSIENIKKTRTDIEDWKKIKEYSILIRELVYEEVRYKCFSGLPSRRNCVWLCDKESLPLWEGKIGGDYDIYKVKATGNIHSCYAGALDDTNINYKILSEKAIVYWSGECIGDINEKEYLFEGRIELLEKIDSD